MSEAQKTILIADDDLEILRILRRHLETDYQVLEAHNGSEALELTETHQPACVVLDVMMPERNGWEVARQLRQDRRYDGVGILMLTAIGESLNEMTSPLYGADDQVDKPFDLDTVSDRIRNIIAQRENS